MSCGYTDFVGEDIGPPDFEGTLSTVNLSTSVQYRPGVDLPSDDLPLSSGTKCRPH